MFYLYLKLYTFSHILTFGFSKLTKVSFLFRTLLSDQLCFLVSAPGGLASLSDLRSRLCGVPGTSAASRVI